MRKTGLVTEIFQEKIKERLYSETEVMGDKAYTVHTQCTSKESDTPIPQDFSHRAKSPEQAKGMALDSAKQMGYDSCKVTKVDLVPDSDQKAVHDLGSGSSMNVDKDAEKGQVMPSEVGKGLDNLDSKA